MTTMEKKRDYSLVGESTRKASLQGGIVRHHSGLDVIIADYGKQRRSQGRVVVLVVDEPDVVDAAAVDHRESPSAGKNERAVRRESGDGGLIVDCEQTEARLNG